jgi:KUP system potassium uptake protein
MLGGAALLADGILTPAVTVTTAIEGLRTDSLYIAGTGIRVSQLLAGVSAAAAAVVLALFYTGKLRHAPRYVDRGAGGQPDA